MTPRRIIRTGRDWTVPTYRSPWQEDRSTRFEPTTLAKLRALYRAEREPLWSSIAAAALLPIAVVSLVLFWWSVSK